MQHGTFGWCDLSTFDMPQAQKFYKTLFDWSFHDQAGYAFCYKGNQQAAGLFPMPDKFVAINMPSFWMSYINVDNIEQSVTIAEANGGKVEVRPESFGADGKIALIRDPAGAGFTVYEGSGLPGRGSSHGQMVWNELIVSSLDLVKSFYEALFDWQVVATESATRFDVLSAESKPITAIEVVDNSIKGREEFWGIYFAVNSLAKALKQVEAGGGSIIYGGPQDGSALIADPMGAHLFLTESVNASGESASDTTYAGKGGFKWRTILGLILVYAAVFLDLSWVWGILFLLWVLPDLSSGVTYFMEPISRSVNPILFWTIVLTWIAMALYVLVEGVF